MTQKLAKHPYLISVSSDGRYVVRLYDGFDNEWMDVSKPCSRTVALRIWREKTENGTKCVSFNDIDYYRVFPADTVMLHRTPT